MDYVAAFLAGVVANRISKWLNDRPVTPSTAQRSKPPYITEKRSPGVAAPGDLVLPWNIIAFLGHPYLTTDSEKTIPFYWYWLRTSMNSFSTSRVVSGFRKVKLEAFSSFSGSG